MTAIDRVRHLRLQWLLARQLSNPREVWNEYRAGTSVSPLLFRSGHRLVPGPGDAPVSLFFEIFANGCYRRCVPLPTRGVVVDIGANIGAFVLDCAVHRPLLTFMAYEPHAQTFERLAHNIEVNGLSPRVQLFNEAVAGVEGDVGFRSGASSTESRIEPASAVSHGERTTVRAVTLATVVERAGRVALLKIDAEGAEAEILEDAGALRLVDAVVGEYHEALVPGILGRVQAALERGGFQPRVSRSRRCGPMFFASRG
jgi:FkbM family methyltransferase